MTDEQDLTTPTTSDNNPESSGEVQQGPKTFEFGPPPDWAAIPDRLKEPDILWCVWEAIPIYMDDGTLKRVNKLPHNGHYRISTRKPQQWMRYEEARDMYLGEPGRWNGVGVLVTKESGLVYGDVDKGTRWPAGWPSTYCEYSPSGNGLRAIWESADGIDRDVSKPVELYGGNAPRFVTVTGQVAGLWGVQRVNGELQDWVDEHAPAGSAGTRGVAQGDRLDQPPEMIKWGDLQPVIDARGYGSLVRRIWEEGWQEDEDRSATLYAAVIELFRHWYEDRQAWSLLCCLAAVQGMAQGHWGDRWQIYVWRTVQKARADSGIPPGFPFQDLNLRMIEEPEKEVRDDGEQVIEGEMVPYSIDGEEQEKLRWLLEMVDRYIFISSRDKYYDRFSQLLVGMEALNKLYKSRMDDDQRGKPTDWFHSHPGAVTADTLGWRPWPYGAEREWWYQMGGTKYANTYIEPTMKPVKGDITPWLDLARYLIKDEQEFQVVQRWLAFTLRHPEEKISWQLIWQGLPRNGKDSLIKPVSQILGPSAGEIKNEDLESGWGDHWAQKKMVTIQEIYQPGNKRLENHLKTTAAATNTGLTTYNMKGGAIVRQPNLVGWIGFTNHSDALHLDPSDARYFVIDSEVPKKPPEYYQSYHRWLDAGGAAAVMHHLLYEVDLEGFTSGQLPYHTPAYLAMAEFAKSDWEIELQEQLECNPDRWRVFGAAQIQTVINQGKGRGVGVGRVSKALQRLGYEKLGVRGRKQLGNRRLRTPHLWALKEESRKYEDMGNGAELYDLWINAEVK